MLPFTYLLTYICLICSLRILLVHQAVVEVQVTCILSNFLMDFLLIAELNQDIELTSMPSLWVITSTFGEGKIFIYLMNKLGFYSSPLPNVASNLSFIAFRGLFPFSPPPLLYILFDGSASFYLE